MAGAQLGKTRREEENLSKAQEGSGTDRAYDIAKVSTQLILVEFNKQIVNGCILNSELWQLQRSPGPDGHRSPLLTRSHGSHDSGQL